MADNIKIVGNILNTTTVTRYTAEDINLIPSSQLQENFGGGNDYIESYVYDAGGNLLNTNYNYLSYKLPPNNGLTPGVNTLPSTRGGIQTTDVGIDSTLATPTSSLYPIIEIDPVKDLQDLGYSSGEFNIRYNFFNNQLSNYIDEALFVKEISADRTEIRLASTTLTDNEIEQTVNSFISASTTALYQVEYLLNFGNNEQYLAVNVALNKATTGYEVLFKLYQPLPLNVQEKQTLWVVQEKVAPYVFDINLDKLITPPPPPTLRGPNFDIPVENQGTISTTYNTYDGLVTNLQSLQNNSYTKLLNLLTTQSADINIDYTDFTLNYGNITGFSFTATGTGITDDIYTNLTGTTSGHGVSATFDVEVSGGTVIGVSGNTEGRLYVNNDELTILGIEIGGTTPEDNIVITVTGTTSGSSFYQHYTKQIFERRLGNKRVSFYDEEDTLNVDSVYEVSGYIPVYSQSLSFPFSSASFEFECDGSYTNSGGTTNQSASTMTELVTVFNNNFRQFGYFFDNNDVYIGLYINPSLKQQYCPSGTYTINVFND